jgi:hypothetical protein
MRIKPLISPSRALYVPGYLKEGKMRIKNDVNELEIYAVAGTHTVVFSLDMKHTPQNLIGFAVERKDNESGKRIWLEGQKCFQSVIPDPAKGQKYPTYLHPIIPITELDLKFDLYLNMFIMKCCYSKIN